MCNIKTGSNVKHHGDLQNLITSAILRQTNTFSVNDIYVQVNEKLVGSKYHDCGSTKQLCTDTIDKLYNICGVGTADDGKYKLTLSWPSINKR